MTRLTRCEGTPHLNLARHQYGAYVDGVLYGRFSNIETAARTALYHGQYGGDAVVRDAKGNTYDKPDLRVFLAHADERLKDERIRLVMAGRQYA